MSIFTPVFTLLLKSILAFRLGLLLDAVTSGADKLASVAKTFHRHE